MRICIVYDCLFPWTVGGAERWYRSLAERLAADGHDVTYLTRQQWAPGNEPRLDGVRVIPVSPDEPLYGPDGNRRIGGALRFGRGVIGHLLRNGRRYDVVHTASFPYFSLLAAAVARPLGRYRIVVDWFEVWTWAYWREYLGAARGAVGYTVQRLCVLVPQRAFCFSELHASRLTAEGLVGDPTPLRGLYAGASEASEPAPAEARVVFAGRHIAEKRAPALVPAVALARRSVPELRATIFGDGPERDRVKAAIADHGLEGIVDAPGFVDAEELEIALKTALCLALPSRREGYGLVVVEAASQGTPSVVVRGADNAAVELVDDGINGVLATAASAEELAAAILRVHAADFPMRKATAAWFERNAKRLSLAASLERVAEAYAVSSARW